VPIDNTGEDAYARRIRLGASQQEIPPPAPADDVPRPPGIELPPHAHAPSEALPGVVVSRAPVRYNLPPPSPDPSLSRVAAANPANADEEEEEEYEPPETVAGEDEPKSLRPGQKGFAERLMTKYGWSKGQGLGADGSGITSALRVQVEKRRKKPDSEGGGFADPKGIGKIIGGKRNVQGNSSENGKFGPMSEVIVLQHMLEGMDLDEEVGDGGLMQEIGDECSEKYGRVERVYIDRRNDTSAKVFVKFTSQLSALRAVNALEGRIFNGNAIIARFHELEKFEKGIYD
jgi:splicing factor 45